MIYDYRDIRTIHLEITERCNASCPMCARNINGLELNPLIDNRELFIDDIKKIFSVSFLQQLNHIYLCGNFGDPIVAKDTIPALEYFRASNNNLLLSLNTNGSARTKDWWGELAKVIGDRGWCIFSIDGLEDTNHIYRKNTIWTKIIENAKAFINAGGKARWEFIVFEHNEHQIEIAKQLANDMGFESFQLKKSSRFIGEDRKDISIKPPKNINFVNSAVMKLNAMDFNSYLDNVSIDCRVSKEKNLYVSAEGLIHPCCWVGNQMYSHRFTKYREQVLELIDKVGKDNINAKNHTIENILSNQYFSLIEQSWHKPSCKDGKLGICAKTCGAELDIFGQQYS